MMIPTGPRRALAFRDPAELAGGGNEQEPFCNRIILFASKRREKAKLGKNICGSRQPVRHDHRFCEPAFYPAVSVVVTE